MYLRNKWNIRLLLPFQHLVMLFTYWSALSTRLCHFTWRTSINVCSNTIDTDISDVATLFIEQWYDRFKRMDSPQFVRVLFCCGYEGVNDWKDRRKEGKNFYVHLWTCFILIVFEVRCIQAGSRAHTVSIKWEKRSLFLRKKGRRPGIHLAFMACRGANLPLFHSLYELSLTLMVDFDISNVVNLSVPLPESCTNFPKEIC